MPDGSSVLVASPRVGPVPRHSWAPLDSSPDAHRERCVKCGLVRRTVETTPGRVARSYQGCPGGPWRHYALRCGGA